MGTCKCHFRAEVYKQGCRLKQKTGSRSMREKNSSFCFGDFNNCTVTFNVSSK